jgi:hypothetical protein
MLIIDAAVPVEGAMSKRDHCAYELALVQYGAAMVTPTLFNRDLHPPTLPFKVDDLVKLNKTKLGTPFNFDCND